MAVVARLRSAGSTIDATCLSTDAVGDLVYISGPDKHVTKIDLWLVDKMPCAGCIIEKSSATSCRVQLSSFVHNIYSGLTPGKTYFAGEDARPALFSSLPAPTPGNPLLAQPVGFAVDTDLLYLTPGTQLTRRIG